MTEEEALKKACDTLNEALALDEAAITAMVKMRFPCNKALAYHPLIEVGGNNDGTYDVGLIGLLNGILRSAPCNGHIFYVLDDGKDRGGAPRPEAEQYDGRLTRFGVVGEGKSQCQP